MLVVRPVSADDLDQLVALAQLAGFGLTTLTRDRALLASRIAESEQSFARDGHRPRGENYLFVMEDLKTGRVVGTAGVVSKVGGFEPFYAYKVETAVHESEELKVRKEVRYLKLLAEHDGPCEIGSLFLAPDYRRHGAGRLLALSRFLFMTQQPQRFDPLVIAEMRGVSDERGNCPFWDAVGRHFFGVEFPEADRLSMVSKKFIANLMPVHPIYIPLLPKEAQAVIGQVHRDTHPALAILKQEGFADAGIVDIFDAGPAVQCPREQIRTVRQSVVSRIAHITDEKIASPPHIIAAIRRAFRACLGTVEGHEGGVRINTETALGLGVRVGEEIRHALLRPPETP